MNSDPVAVNSQEPFSIQASTLSKKVLVILAKHLFAGGGFRCSSAFCLFSGILIL